MTSPIQFMSTDQIRSKFLDYFENNGHTKVDSSSLIPGNDPTLLFTNAGMVQFKDVFLGDEKRDYNRATSSQRCVRAGGKHNDLDNVGYTARHHTFFEMLGNFSFGDYFKEQAIRFAWKFLTEELGLPEDRLWVTVYKDDKDAEKIWFESIGINQQRFSRLGEKDNFWSMGDTGPCGPCSEIFFDHGSDVEGGPPGSADEDGDRYIEIWNLVFMEFNRLSDGTMTKLPNPSIDTGMGLERVAAIMQAVHTNYEIDLFSQLIADIAHITGIKNQGQASLNVIADHIRSCAFLIADGVVPSNEGRGYVLRRIIRRAIRHGHKLGITDTFFYKTLTPLAKQMSSVYPELIDKGETIERLLKREEEQFLKTLEKGLAILEQAVSRLNNSVLPGDVVFKLYDTFGFPFDLTADIARERQLEIDRAGFDQCMQQQRDKARAASRFDNASNHSINLDGETHFSGYEKSDDSGTIIYIESDSEDSTQHINVPKLETGATASIILDNTSFYAESGGQVGDTGYLECSHGKFKVTDTQKSDEFVLHKGKVISGYFELDDKVSTIIAADRRADIACNHSATHLMHAALKRVLGNHVNQKGSLVDANRLRFDFSHLDAVTSDELIDVENLVNEQIRQNHPVNTELMKPEEAKADGAMALFGEKYGDEVRVLSMGQFSKELCGGTHVTSTGEIGVFRILSETGISAGVRRIEAISGAPALGWCQSQTKELQKIAILLKSDVTHAYEKSQQLAIKSRNLEKEIEQLNAKLATGSGSDIANDAEIIGDVSVLIKQLDGVDPKSLRTTMDHLKNKLNRAVIILATSKESKVSLIAGVTKNLTSQFHAGTLVNQVAEDVGGKGGGRPDMAQAGGSQPENLEQALKSIKDNIIDQLG